MKKELLFLLSVLQVFTATAQADYQQVVNSFRDLYNRQQTDSIFSMYSSRVKEMLPMDKTKQTFTQMFTQFGSLLSLNPEKQDANFARYKATFANSILTMILALDKDSHIDGLRFIPYQTEQAGMSHKEDSSNISLKNAEGNIYGTLLLPERRPKVPVVLIIAGSGPTDRNGNSPMGVNTNMYKMLADSLLQYGIASLRYDKRGIGESKAAFKSESELKFDDMVSDAVGFIKMLKADDRFSKVIVLGHSEGSLIGMIAAGRGKADAYISIAGAGDRIDKIIERQLASQSPQMAATATVIFDSLSKGYTVQDPGSELTSLFRSSIQPYMISWLQYNPQQEIKKLKIPVLIIQGTTDLQVSVQDAQLLKKAKPEATLELIEQMNHVLKLAAADRQANIATYSKPDLPIKPELTKYIEEFVHNIN